MLSHREKIEENREIAPFMMQVEKIARYMDRKTPSNVTFDDLRSAGYEMLAEIWRQKGEQRKERAPEQFQAYVAQRVRGAMLDYLRTINPNRRSRRVYTERDEPEKIRPIDLNKETIAVNENQMSQEQCLDRKRLGQMLLGQRAGIAECYRRVLLQKMQGREVKEIAKNEKISQTRVCQMTKEVSQKLEDYFRGDIPEAA
jgi:RNA polymerase sigma factor (sigma-70 family)